MKYYAYCPVMSDKLGHTTESVFRLAKPHLVDGKVLVLNFKDLTNAPSIRVVNYFSCSADSYGYDLYLFSVDQDDKLKLISCGGFE